MQESPACGDAEAVQLRALPGAEDVRVVAVPAQPLVVLLEREQVLQESPVAIVENDVPVLLFQVRLNAEHPRIIGVPGIAVVVEVVLVAVVFPELPDLRSISRIRVIHDFRRGDLHRHIVDACGGRV